MIFMILEERIFCRFFVDHQELLMTEVEMGPGLSSDSGKAEVVALEFV